MPFQERLEEFIDSRNGFGTSVELLLRDRKIILDGILIRDYVEIESGLSGFSGNKSVFELPSSNGEIVNIGDKVIADKIRYSVREIFDDGYGWMSIVLERTDKS